jgi:hypothetical protein
MGPLRHGRRRQGRTPTCPSARRSPTAPGSDRPRSVTTPAIVVASIQAGPHRPDTIHPLRSVSAQLPNGRSRSSPSAHGGRDPSAGPSSRPGLTSSSGHSSSTPTAANQRPSGENAGRPAKPPASSSNRGCDRFERGPASTSTAQIFVNGARSASSPRLAANATVRPFGCHVTCSTPQSPRVTCRAGPAARPAAVTSRTNRCDQRSRWPTSSHRQSARATRRAVAAGSFDERAPSTRRPVGPRPRTAAGRPRR